MRFKTQHKNFTGAKGGSYRAHRDKNRVWVTSSVKDRDATMGSKVYKSVSQAKDWMENPTVTFE